jgi:nitrate reductase NapAB chaperone NapD
MPICSYLVQAAHGHAAEVVDRLAQLPGCTPTPSDDGRAIVLVTDTPDLAAESRLQRQLDSVPGIDALVLTFGYTEPENLDQLAETGLPEVDDE